MRKFFAACPRLCVLFIIAAIFVSTAFAQNFSDRQKNDSAKENSPAAQNAAGFEQKNGLSVLGGFAPWALSSSRKSTFGFLAVRYSRRIATGENFTIKYQIDFVPLNLINYDRRQTIQTSPTTAAVQHSRDTVYGIGLTPVGFQLNLRRRKKVQPFTGIDAGLIVFSKIIPDERSPLFPIRAGTRLNFGTSAGGGVEIATESNRSYTFGYKYHHISNASRGNINPGFNQNLFYFGYTFKKW